MDNPKESTGGSNWRKWDLHIHTPYSLLNNQFGSVSFDEYVHQIIKKAIETNTACIGITDYFLISGYKRFRKILDDPEALSHLFSEEIKTDSDYLNKIHQLLILCDIEFRLSQEITDSHNKSSKIQFHVLFSDEVSPDEIERNFLGQLCFSSQFNGMTSDKTYITESDLFNFGKRFVEKNPEIPNKNPLYNGLTQASVSFDDVRRLLSNDRKFEKKYLLILPEEDVTDIKWTAQSGTIRKMLYSGSDCLFTSNKNTIEWGKSENCELFLGKKMPCLWGSDAHDFAKAFSPSNSSFLWIKSDVTFLGLIEAVKSFEERIFIGPIPPELELFESRKAFTIKDISIYKKPQSKGSEVWFNVQELPINPFLVSIIGNRGSGKSALADVLALSGFSKRMDDASFLNGKRFLNRKEGFGNRYIAQMSWANGTKGDEIALDFIVPQDAVEKVQYLPQSSIENICNSLDRDFEDEVNGVIFSYIDTTEKLDTTSLDQLIAKKTNALTLSIERKRANLLSLNQKIVALETKCTDAYKQSVSSQLVAQNDRLQAHEKNKPSEVQKPKDTQLDEKTILSAEIQKKIKELDLQIQEKTALLSKNNKELNALSDYRQRFNLEKAAYEAIVKEGNALSKEYGFLEEIDFPKFSFPPAFDKEIARLQVELNTLQTFVSEEKISEVSLPNDICLDVDSVIKQSEKYQSLVLRKRVFELCSARIQKQLSEETQLYFSYLANLQNWEKEKKMIQGDLPDPSGRGSVKQFVEESEYLKNKAGIELANLKKERSELISSLLADIESERGILRQIFETSWKSISGLLGENVKDLEFSVKTICDDDFSTKIVSFINQTVKSNFQGSASGLEYVKRMVEKTDFDNNDSVFKLISRLLEDSTGDVNNISRLLKNEEIPLLDYLTSLRYLTPKYRLSLGGRDLNQLSPGEKGLVLLIFYLALSNKNCPLIIDQPEDNLDNQTIFEKLVPCIKKAKKKRQIIIVTHNPNIAVACDSEQIIYCSRNPDKLELSYSSGSIENPSVAKELLDVLEGTDPAFDFREKKYGKK